ncbi:MAG TPA: YceI family protein, partial [Leptospiraceae bacterium]|nr:YceI family protein [Leptospiraceae bacterium]
GADGAVTVTGNLDIKGISKSVSFPAKITYAADKKTGSAKANFNINRKLWKIEYPGKPDDLIRDEVNIDLDLAI